MGEFLEVAADDVVVPEAQKVRLVQDDDEIRGLADSIAVNGLLQPLVVQAVDGKYRLIAGHRRLLAVRLLGWGHVAVHVIPGECDGPHGATLVENMQRRDLSIIEEACAIRDIIESGVADVDGVAKTCGRSRAWVDRRLEVLSWPGDMQEAVHTGALSVAAAAELVGIADEGTRNSLVAHAIEHGISRKTAALWVQQQSRGEMVHGPGVYVEPTAQGSGEVYTVKVRCFSCAIEFPLERVQRIAVCGDCLECMQTAVDGAVPLGGEPEQTLR